MYLLSVPKTPQVQPWSVLSGCCTLLQEAIVSWDPGAKSLPEKAATCSHLPARFLYVLWHVYHQRLTTEIVCVCCLVALRTLVLPLPFCLLNSVPYPYSQLWPPASFLLGLGTWLVWSLVIPFHRGCFMHHLSCSLQSYFSPFSRLISHCMSDHILFVHPWECWLMWIVLLWTCSTAVLLLLLGMARCPGEDILHHMLICVTFKM